MRSHNTIDDVDTLERVLTDPSLGDQIDMVMSNPSESRYRVATSEGSIEFTRHNEIDHYSYEVVDRSGIDPFRQVGTAALLGLDTESAHPHPVRNDNAFPHAFDQIAQFFDGIHAPELFAQATTTTSWGGNLGDHGSLAIVQARAPFIAAGAGVAASGYLDDSTRMVDVAPSVLHLLGGSHHPAGVGPTGAPRADALLQRQDGDARTNLFERGAAEHVVLITLDGCNLNVVVEMVERGLLPHIGSLIDRGLALRHGVISSLPTATVANHTTAATGAHPGHSGVLHHTWWDRRTDAVPDLLAMPEMFTSSSFIDPSVETIHQAVHRTRPEAFTVAALEFGDTGADFSTYREMAAGESEPLPEVSELESAEPTWLEQSAMFAFMSSADELAIRQVERAWSRHGNGPLPSFTSLGLYVTDEAGHIGGPNADITRCALRDSDRRVGRLLDAVDRSGAFERTAFIVISDHGMELTQASRPPTWGDALRESAVSYRQIDGAFVYLDDGRRPSVAPR